MSDCKHDLKHCDCCDGIHCKKCGRKWGAPHWYVPSQWYVPSYPDYPSWQYIGGGTGDTARVTCTYNLEVT